MGQVIPLTPLGADIVLSNADLVNAINLPSIPENAKMAQVYVDNDAQHSSDGIRYLDNSVPSGSLGKVIYPTGLSEFYGSMRTVQIIRMTNSAALKVIITYFG